MNAFGGLRDNATVGLGEWVSTFKRGARGRWPWWGGGVANPAVVRGRPKLNPPTQLVSARCAQTAAVSFSGFLGLCEPHDKVPNAWALEHSDMQVQATTEV